MEEMLRNNKFDNLCQVTAKSVSNVLYAVKDYESCCITGTSSSIKDYVLDAFDCFYDNSIGKITSLAIDLNSRREEIVNGIRYAVQNQVDDLRIAGDLYANAEDLYYVLEGMLERLNIARDDSILKDRAKEIKCLIEEATVLRSQLRLTASLMLEQLHDNKREK